MGVSKNNARSKIRSKSSALSSNLKKSKPSALSVSNSEVSDQLIAKKQSKLEKKLAKSLTFTSRIQSGSGAAAAGCQNAEASGQKVLNSNDPAYRDFSSISKSAVRRRKKKLKESLKPKLHDLLSTLNDIETVNSGGESNNSQGAGGIASGFQADTRKKISHAPNPHKSKRGQAKVETMERQNFNVVLNNQSYRADPFASLKDQIQRNMSAIQ